MQELSTALDKLDTYFKVKDTDLRQSTSTPFCDALSLDKGSDLLDKIFKFEDIDKKLSEGKITTEEATVLSPELAILMAARKAVTARYGLRSHIYGGLVSRSMSNTSINKVITEDAKETYK